MTLNAFSLEKVAPSAALLGLSALAAQLQCEGVALSELFARTGLQPGDIDNAYAPMSPTQRMAVFANAQKLSPGSDVALRAGARQRIGDFGIYGFAMASSATFGDGLEFGIAHMQPAMPFLRPTLRVQGDVAILACAPAERFGTILPFVAEFWRSSLNSLFQRVLEAPLPARRLVCNYPAPPHWRSYAPVFGCKPEFDANVLEWHFDAAILGRACPGANSITHELCRRLSVAATHDGHPAGGWAGRVRSTCLEDARCMVSVTRLAERLGVSVRTLHRRLASEGVTFKSVVDQTRKELAIGYLSNSNLPVVDIAERVGFSEATNFRKAFRRWTGKAPSDYRVAA
jgi:AraC-like DNA-binding protein